jgi:hypothetical protein
MLSRDREPRKRGPQGTATDRRRSLQTPALARVPRPLPGRSRHLDGAALSCAANDPWRLILRQHPLHLASPPRLDSALRFGRVSPRYESRAGYLHEDAAVLILLADLPQPAAGVHPRFGMVKRPSSDLPRHAMNLHHESGSSFRHFPRCYTAGTRSQAFVGAFTARDAFPRPFASLVCSGGGGNRTRVRDRTGVSVYKHRPRLKFIRRPVRGRPTDRLALLKCRASGEWLSFGSRARSLMPPKAAGLPRATR